MARGPGGRRFGANELLGLQDRHDTTAERATYFKESGMNRLKIALATAATLALGYAAAFGGSGLGPSLAAASKTTIAQSTASTCFAGNSTNTKLVSTSTSTFVQAGNGSGPGGGNVKVSTSTTTTSSGPGAQGVCK
jgi:hypothetical protein